MQTKAGEAIRMVLLKSRFSHSLTGHETAIVSGQVSNTSRHRFAATLAVGLGLVLAATAAAATSPRWTAAQASAALMRHAEDFTVEAEQSRDLTAAKCRGTGRAVARRFVTFTCTGTFQRGASEPAGSVRVRAKTRRAGGLCWTTAAVIPSGCFAPGRRAEGNVGDAWVAMYRTIDDRTVQNGQCLPHGAGFFSCSWSDAGGTHRGIVVFRPLPVARVLG